MVNRTPPLVQTWSSPVRVRLTEEGRTLAEEVVATAITTREIEAIPGLDAAAVHEAAQARRAAATAANPPAPKKRRKDAKQTAVGEAGACAAGASARGAPSLRERACEPR